MGDQPSDPILARSQKALVGGPPEEVAGHLGNPRSRSWWEFSGPRRVRPLGYVKGVDGDSLHGGDLVIVSAHECRDGRHERDRIVGVATDTGGRGVEEQFWWY